MHIIDTAIIIGGPTTTGKSEISALLARQINGAIINSDNYYFYLDQNFHIGLGLSKDEPPTDIPCYLFGIRKIFQPKPDPEEFYSLVIEAAENALSKGLTPIIQGCSFTLNHKLIAAGCTKKIVIPIWSAKEYLLERCYKRVKQMLEEGLLAEAQQIIDESLDTSWMAQEGIIYRPTIDFLKAQGSDTEKLISSIVKGISDKAEEQELKYRTLSGVTWIKHDNAPLEAASKIITLLNQHA